MSMTDPVSDRLTRIRNANQALHPTVSMPSSKPVVVPAGSGKTKRPGSQAQAPSTSQAPFPEQVVASDRKSVV